MASWVDRILILAKTYPSPSSQYIETSCVAGISESGKMVRLYPVPFRMIETGNQFSKWQWIEVRIEKATKDHRVESHKIYTDTVSLKHKVKTDKSWSARWDWINKIPSFNSFDSLESSRESDSISLALLKPKKIIELVVEKAKSPDWTEEEKQKLTYEQLQGNLFSEGEVKKQVKELRKVPFDFYYQYSCESELGQETHKHKIVDWEVGQLYWNCRLSHGENWEVPFRNKLESELVNKELMFLMGNIHRFQNQWLIISLIYPPKLKHGPSSQPSLF